MVDMAKKVNKKSELMDAGEKCVAATTILKAGHFKKQVAGRALGGAVGMAIAGAMNKDNAEIAEGSMADDFPQMQQAILALTNQRWIVFEHSVMSGGPKAVHSTYALGDIAGAELDMGKLVGTLTLAFSDGSTIDMEAPKPNKPQKLVDAVAAAR